MTTTYWEFRNRLHWGVTAWETGAHIGGGYPRRAPVNGVEPDSGRLKRITRPTAEPGSLCVPACRSECVHDHRRRKREQHKLKGVRE